MYNQLQYECTAVQLFLYFYAKHGVYWLSLAVEQAYWPELQSAGWRRHALYVCGLTILPHTVCTTKSIMKTELTSFNLMTFLGFPSGSWESSSDSQHSIRAFRSRHQCFVQDGLRWVTPWYIFKNTRIVYARLLCHTFFKTRNEIRTVRTVSDVPPAFVSFKQMPRLDYIWQLSPTKHFP